MRKMNEVIENKKKSEVLAEKIIELNYGDVLTHEQIASLIKEDYPSNKYTSTIAKAKKILLKKYNKTICCQFVCDHLHRRMLTTFNYEDICKRDFYCRKRKYV